MNRRALLQLLTLLMLLMLLMLLALADATAVWSDGTQAPPKLIRYSVGAGGTASEWLQVSDAGIVVMLEQCGDRDEFLEAEAGSPGAHRRALPGRPMRSCLELNEFRDGELLGSYGPITLTLRRLALPRIEVTNGDR